MVNWILIGAGVGIGITVLGSILGWAVFPIVVRNQIDESITLVEGSEQFERWVNIPQALDFKVYIFNVTNAEAVQNGAIPSVQQIGPYVYSQYRKKTIQEFSEDRVFVTYTQQQTYFFNARASAPLTENDRIVVLNMAMNSIIQTAPENQLNLVNLGIEQVFDFPTSMFVTTTPREYLFDGVPFCLNRTGLAPGALCFTVAQQESSSLRVMEDGSIRFSFFYEKNSTHDGVFKVHTGLHDTQRITEIQEWEGSPVLSHWINPIVNTTSVCNMINGTDSASFPPHLSASGRLQIFSSDICRSVNIFFDQRTTYEGITGFRFVTTDDFLNQIGPQYSTECFCIDSIPNVPKDSNGCLLPGALDLSICRAKLLKYKHNLTNDKINKLVCIAERQSAFKNELITYDFSGTGYHGIFQISDNYWCSNAAAVNNVKTTRNYKNVCKLNCDNLRDSDLTDDLKCVDTIYNEHQRLSGDGFNAWITYENYCHDFSNGFVDYCYVDNNSEHTININNIYSEHNENLLGRSLENTKNDLDDDDDDDDDVDDDELDNNSVDISNADTNNNSANNINNINNNSQVKSKVRIFERCELARELYYVHKLSIEDIPIWVCIAKHESNYNTSAIGRLNADGSEDHGLFQISDIYWCSPPGAGWMCRLSCSKLEDSDITDDINCMKKIYHEHQRISGDGFTAWSVYLPYCKGRSKQFVNDCFAEDKNVEYKPDNNVITNELKAARLATTLERSIVKSIGDIKIYKKCELANLLFDKYQLPFADVNALVCIAQYQSGYNTGIINYDSLGNGYHGMFQISDSYWCTSGDDVQGKVCNINCKQLRDDNLSDDLLCIKKIHKEHERLFGDGYNAWTVYQTNCNNALEFIHNCFDNDHQKAQSLIKMAHVKKTSTSSSGARVNKVFNKCDLAKLFKHYHNLPYHDVNTLVCIAQYQSGFNSAALNRDATGSGYHGLYQISDVYWCSNDGGRGKACDINCDQLRDTDFTNDLMCIDKIREEHQRLSGDGFNAWTVYPQFCKNIRGNYLTECFDRDYQRSELKTTSTTSAPIINKKVFNKCELAKLFKHNHNLPYNDVNTLVCIAQYQSGFNSAALNRDATGSGYHGLYQISDVYWCSNDGGRGKACDINCDQLRDTDFTDDLMCIDKIREEHQRLSGDGFNAWTVYPQFCKNIRGNYLTECFDRDYQRSELKTTSTTSAPIINKKVFNKCELAKLFKHNHNLPYNDVNTLVCIAQYQSGFNSAALNRDATGSGYHGLYQISDVYWCSNDGGRGKACDINCDQLRDTDFTDDLMCIDKIREDHQRLSGDGFNAWTVYPQFCKNIRGNYLTECFDRDYQRSELKTTSSTSAPIINKKVFNKCELAKLFKHNHNLPYNDVNTLVCIAQYQSGFNSAALNRDATGSGYHGLYQISDVYWCSNDGGRGKACDINCDQLRDTDFTDDLMCIDKIREEHQRLSGDGFNAWTVYPQFCKNIRGNYLTECFDRDYQRSELKTTSSTSAPIINKKVFNKCDLAKLFKHYHNLPYHDVNTLVCIAQYQSGFNSASLNRDATGSGYHGLYQISDVYWCSNDGGRGKACDINCDQLRDTDFTDDLMCIDKIREEHQRLSGDGFNAWTVYPQFCKNIRGNYLTECFDRDYQRSELKTTSTTSAPIINKKVFNKCDLAKLFKHNHNLPYNDVNTLVCIAQYQSGFNSAALNRDATGSGYHGLYQISDVYWCSNDGGRGKACDINCDQLRDTDFTDDLLCIDKIREEHQRLSGDGFNAWTVYPQYCKNIRSNYLTECFDGDYPHIQLSNSIKAPIKTSSSSIDKCKLFTQLNSFNNLSIEKINTLVCIAQYQSGLKYAAINYDSDGIGYHGLFQISDKYWCSNNTIEINSKECKMECNQLRDNDLTDDILCIEKIYNEHQRLSGDGYNAWTAYTNHCNGITLDYTNVCLLNKEFTKQLSVAQTLSAGNNNALSADDTKTPNRNKIFERCELARELHYKHNIPMEQIATWVCIAKHESNFNTSAIGRLNADGSEDHGLFQISDIYWCSPPGAGWVCGLSCAKLEDSDITDDVECMKKIYLEHQQISGDGFTAWSVYRPHCKNRSTKYIDNCFKNIVDTNSIIPFENYPSTLSSADQHRPVKRISKGKVYSRCELAIELRDKHKIPMKQIGVWVCIAKYESNFNTSAIGRLNVDGSGDHGLFQISDIYWCSINSDKSHIDRKACKLSCNNLEDNDITDDVECIRKIYDEHQRLSGNGFNAWTVYKPYCKEKSENYVSDCFVATTVDGDEELPFIPQRKPGIMAPTQPQPHQLLPKITKPKIYTRCELANELLTIHNIPMKQIGVWVCIAKYESNFNTSAIGRLNADGSEDHGLFQISDIYWCSPPGTGWACGLSCAKLEDSDITDDVECIKKIYREHQQISGDGFTAWSVYKPYCKGKSDVYVKDCFKSVVVDDSLNFVTPTQLPILYKTTSTTTTTTLRPTTMIPSFSIPTIKSTTEKYFNFETPTTTKPFYQLTTTTIKPYDNDNRRKITTKRPTLTSTTKRTTAYDWKYDQKYRHTTIKPQLATTPSPTPPKTTLNIFNLYFNGFQTQKPTTYKPITDDHQHINYQNTDIFKLSTSTKRPTTTKSQYNSFLTTPVNYQKIPLSFPATTKKPSKLIYSYSFGIGTTKSPLFINYEEIDDQDNQMQQKRRVEQSFKSENAITTSTPTTPWWLKFTTKTPRITTKSTPIKTSRITTKTPRTTTTTKSITPWWLKSMTTTEVPARTTTTTKSITPWWLKSIAATTVAPPRRTTKKTKAITPVTPPPTTKSAIQWRLKGITTTAVPSLRTSSTIKPRTTPTPRLTTKSTTPWWLRATTSTTKIPRITTKSTTPWWLSTTKSTTPWWLSTTTSTTKTPRITTKSTTPWWLSTTTSTTRTPRITTKSTIPWRLSTITSTTKTPRTAKEIRKLSSPQSSKISSLAHTTTTKSSVKKTQFDHIFDLFVHS